LENNIKNLSKELVKNNLKATFGIPGSGMSLSLIDELEKYNIPFFLTNFEGSASLMASTYGLVSNSLGVSISIKGPGLINSIPGISASWFESFPLIHLAESYNYNSRKYLSHKRINQNIISKEISKGSYYLNNDKNELNKIINFSKSEVPGPVLIQLQSKEKQNYFKSFINYDFNTDEKSLKNLFQNCKKPLIILGSLASRKVNHNFINKIKLPVFTTAAAKGLFNEFKENSLGIYTGVGLKLSHEFNIINDSDLIIGVGLCPKELLSVKKFPCKSINFQSLEIDGNEKFKFDMVVDINYFEKYLNIIINNSWGLKKIKNIKKKLNYRMLGNFLPANVYELINNIDNDIRSVFDTGFFCTIGEHILKSKKDNLCLMSANSKYMGTSIPMAIGASMGDKRTPVIVFIGDGGIGMYLSEVLLAVKNNLPILFILFTDGGFASIRKSALNKGITEKPLEFQNDWTGIFESFKINSYRCDNISSTYSIISNWTKKPCPFFLEIAFNKNKYLNMVNDLR